MWDKIQKYGCQVLQHDIQVVDLKFGIPLNGVGKDGSTEVSFWLDHLTAEMQNVGGKFWKPENNCHSQFA